jgi:hypothetical protein
MKHFLTGVAVAASLAIATPGWAQNAPPPAPAMPAAPAANSAMPPAHHAVRHAHAMHHFHKGMAQKAALSGDTTAQLNREELARIQSGAPPSPPMASPPPPMPNPSGGNSMGMPGPNAGGPGLSPYSSGAGGGGLGR